MEYVVGIILVFVGGFLAGKEYGTTVTISKMGGSVIAAAKEYAQQSVQQTSPNVCPFCGLECGDKPYHIMCDPACR